MKQTHRQRDTQTEKRHNY